MDVDVLRILLQGVWGSVRHPRTTLTFTRNPKKIANQPIPWQASLLTLAIAIAGACFAHNYGMDALEKVCLVIVGGAGGNLLGMSIGIKNNKTIDK